MPTKAADTSSSMQNTPTPPQASQSPIPTPQSACDDKAVVVGLYGVPGSGKTTLLERLKPELGLRDYEYYDGSGKIDKEVPGGLKAFQKMSESEQTHWREHTIGVIGKDCLRSGKTAVIAGHFMFWSQGKETGDEVCTAADLETYTHIIYLDVLAETVAQRCQDDKSRNRLDGSVDHLRRWQESEKSRLRLLCRDHSILYIAVSEGPNLLHQVSTLLKDFRHHGEGYNLSKAERQLDKVLGTSKGQLKTMLVIDADRTLAAEDTGNLFWELKKEEATLRDLFRSPLGYSYTAFRQATLLYEETADEQGFDALCHEVAKRVTMHRELVSFLKRVADEKHVGAVVVSCGLRRVWEKVLKSEGLSKAVAVIGGGRIADGFVVTAAVKGALVARLRDTHRLYVWAFGDSPLDLMMMSKADRAIVVVGDERTRSKTMDTPLKNAIDHLGLHARQALLPGNATPRLDLSRLPVIQLTDDEFISAIFDPRDQVSMVKFVDATDKPAAKILMTPTRDSKIAGPALRKSHGRIGRYLSTQYLTDLIGLETFTMPHVLGHTISGYRLKNEKETTIVALMRGGEPMALGVSDVFPLAMFVHVDHSNDLKLHHLEGQHTVLLVDSVVNTGKTVLQFIERVRRFNSTVRIVVVAGIIQADFASGAELAQVQASDKDLIIVALRLSTTKYTGSGTNDTGNRLFNTTHLR